jgi:hypothetical protein
MEPVVGIAIAGILGAVVAFRARRLAPGVPRHWRSSQSVAARLCRRAHRAVDNADVALRRARKQGVPVALFEDAVGDLRACVTAIDHRLVAASKLPLGARHRALLDLRYRIVDVEKASARVVTMAAEADQLDAARVRASVQEVHRRLDGLEAARRELRDLGPG